MHNIDIIDWFSIIQEKVKLYYMRIFLSGLFLGVMILIRPIAAYAADTVLVIGDSIAVGTASALAATKTSAVVGATSKTIAGFDGSGTFTHMVISAGSNDKGQNYTFAQEQSYLRAIRDKQPSAKTVWILPYDAAMKSAVQAVATSYGDSTVDLSQFPSSDGLHPSSYSTLAASVKTVFGSTGAASPGSNAASDANAAGDVAASRSSFTGLVPCGDATTPCTLCHFVTGIANIITRIRDVMFFIGLAIITAMGILYIVSGGNQKLMETAKSGIKTTLIGIIFVLFAWFIVNMVMFYIFDAWDDLGVGAELKGANGYEFQCNATSRSGQQVSIATNPSSIGNPGSDGSNGSGNGSCTAVPSGPCSVASLTPYFGDKATQASMICNVESRGDAARASSTDRCKNDPAKRAFSWGLFQINLTVHTLDGKDCSKAFEGKNYDCRIIDETLYSQCVAAAKNSEKNIQKAVSLSSSGSSWSPWLNSKNKCGL
jgi:hypothetical protein